MRIRESEFILGAECEDEAILDRVKVELRNIAMPCGGDEAYDSII